MSYAFYDTLRNFVTGLGMPGVDPTKSVQHILCLLDRNQLENMYRGDWLARKICDAPADDITREWRSWQANQDQIEKIEMVEKTMDLQRKVKRWITLARLYGGSALVLGIDDGLDPSQPVDLNKCGKGCLRYVVVLHRYELNAGPRIYNVADPYYTRAAYYTVATPMFGFEGESGITQPDRPGQTTPAPGSINSFWNTFSNVIPFRIEKKEQQEKIRQMSMVPTNIGMTQIHPSRVLELPGNELPDWRLAPLGGGWGDSSLQTVIDTVNDFITTMQASAAIVNDSKVDVVKIPNMALNLKNDAYNQKLLERFSLAARTKSVLSALLLDKEEEWERTNTQMSGLPLIMHEFMTLVSAAADIPVSRLFGQAQGQGLSGGSTSGGPDDMRNYYDACSNKQKNDIAPRLGMLDQVLQISALGKTDPNVHYKWNPLWQLSQSDKAAIAYQKAQATQIYSTIGIINEDALREAVSNQLIEDGTYPGLEDSIEEHGLEPEEPEEAGGFQMPEEPGEEASPNPKEIGHAGATSTAA